MGYYNGNLHDIIKRNRLRDLEFTIKEITHISKHILAGLKILHNNKLIHRDLKSTNIFYEGDPKKTLKAYFVIGDLGESKMITKCEQPKTIKGTPAWIAPEIYKGKGKIPYSFSADIWSFGMILYEMITLQFPYNEHRFVSEIIESGKKPKLSKEQIYKYASLIPLWEECTYTNPELRTSASLALLSVLTLINYNS
jgi:NIMA (never in mitosis gene a)-related kinase